MTMRSSEIARNARPGQFAQILCAGSNDPLLPRPFSFFKTDAHDFSILYHALGKGTGLLTTARKGDSLWVLGPLGNGFSMPRRGAATAPLLVGGGVGIPPLYHLAQTLLKKKHYEKKDIQVILGARNKALLLCESEFKKLGVSVSVATDDGSKGAKGFVTTLLQNRLQPSAIRLQSRLYACGPTPMLKAVSALSEKFKVPCEVSVEVPMACGFGACLGCAIKVREKREEGRGQETHRFAIACTEGPVFQAGDILWD
jgi:dihydroorotate dehydrogenase electron transfer subunit